MSVQLSEGTVETVLDTLLTTAVSGSGYGLPPPRRSDSGRTLVWQPSYAGGPSAVSVALQGSMDDVDANYVNLDTSTNTAGESKTINNVGFRWIRGRAVSRTGGTETFIKVIIQ